MLPRADRRSNRVTIRIVRNAFFLGFAVASVAAFVACVGDDPIGATTPTADAGGDVPVAPDDAMPDTGVDAGVPGAIDAPFTKIEHVDAFSTADGDYGLSFTADGLSVYVATGFGTQEIRVHTRTSTNVPFGAAIPLSGMPTSIAYNFSPAIRADGKELFFTYRPKPNGLGDIWRADIGGGGAQNAAPAPGINDPDAGAIEDGPFLANERVLYFGRTSASGRAIHRAERASTSVPFTSVMPVSGLGVYPDESNPVVTADELHIYFSAREEDAGPGGPGRILRASRVNMQMPYGPAVPVDGLDVPGRIDAPLWLTPDRCALYFLSDREKTTANDPDIWVARREP